MAFLRAGNRVVVTFAHRGEALRTMSLLRRVEPELLEPGARLPAEPQLLFAVAPVRRGFVSRDSSSFSYPMHRSSGSARRERTRASAKPSRASPICGSVTTSSTRITASDGCSGSRTKTVAGVTRDYLFLAFRGDDRLYVPHEQIGKVSRYVGADGRLPRSRSSAARPGRT